MTKSARSIGHIAGIGAAELLMLLVTGWGVLALRYWDHAGPLVRNGVALLYGIGSLALMIGFALGRRRWRIAAAFLALFALLIAFWCNIAPSNDGNWLPENAVLPYSTMDGSRIRIHNIRNFDYRSESDFTPAYYDRDFDLRRLNSVDLFAVYWMGPAIAHIFLSFGFSDNSHVAISIEARKERGQAYSSIQGFFRQYELYYAVGDERDIVRLRTNYRHNPPEHVYLYRLQGNITNAQRVFLAYLAQINALKNHPEWYNTLTTNCTTNIWLHSRVNPRHVPFSWRILFSGYLPGYLYQLGKLDGSLPFDELTRRANINTAAHAADHAADFSARIRVNLPTVSTLSR